MRASQIETSLLNVLAEVKRRAAIPEYHLPVSRKQQLYKIIMEINTYLDVDPIINASLLAKFRLNDTSPKELLNTVQGLLEGKPDISEGWSLAMTITFFVVIFIGSINNLVVIFAIFNHAKIRGLYHNLFIATLATSDLMMSAVTLPITLWEVIYYDWPFAADSNGFCGFILAIKKLPLFLSAAALCGIAWDRYLSITYPER